MLINKVNKDGENHVSFVSYTGKYPNLCSGVLTLKIDGVEVMFGHNHIDYDYRSGKYKDKNYSSFWQSGGSCGFTNGYSESYVHRAEWGINIESLPEKFRKYASEIDEVFNANVPYGCCGGCL